VTDITKNSRPVNSTQTLGRIGDRKSRDVLYYVAQDQNVVRHVYIAGTADIDDVLSRSKYVCAREDAQVQAGAAAGQHEFIKAAADLIGNRFGLMGKSFQEAGFGGRQSVLELRTLQIDLRGLLLKSARWIFIYIIFVENHAY